MKLVNNYHTHTSRCGHASGKDEEYVLKAIERGIKVLGFSDHLMIPNIDEPKVRGNFSLVKDYVDSINSLKDKYKDQIKIHVGFEAEYSPKLLPLYSELKEKYGIEYFILGQHCFYDGEKNNYYLRGGYDISRITKYTNDLIEGMKSGIFKYVCHPDLLLIKYGIDNPIIQDSFEKIISSAVKYDIPLEINLCGRRRKDLDEKHIYASEAFFRITSKYNAKVIIGLDAHSPEELADDENLKFAYDLIDKYQLNCINRIKI